MRIIGIYTITNLLDNKIYVGYSTYLKSRLNHHKSFLERGKHTNLHLQYAYNLYGEENFKFEVLEECDEKYLVSQEHYWCTVLNTHNRDYGYNILPTNPYEINKRMALESRIKLGNSQRGRTLSEEHKKNISKGGKGRIVSKETIEKKRIARLGQRYSEEKKLIIKEKQRATRQKTKDALPSKIIEPKSIIIIDYYIELPSKQIIIINHLRNFAKENGLSHSKLYETLKGYVTNTKNQHIYKVYTHKGYKLIKKESKQIIKF